jgi:hypothetical protein
VDDFSIFTWIYPMKHKSEVFAHFVKFKLLVENQFASHIKQFQSDGGGEYTSVQFQTFLTKEGIIHRKSCPYTSQQNVLAERKLRHILETGLTPLAHSHLSNKYWVDAFLTAMYIINRLPTPTLQNASPYSKVNNREPNYKKLRIFGCLCYPLLRPYGLHKLEFRSKPCIFLGYINAGCKCLYHVNNKAYLSKQVIFNEQSFPAQDQATTLLPSKINAQGDAPLLISVPIPFTLVLPDAPNHNVDSISNEPSPLAQTKPPSPAAPISLIMPSPTVPIFFNSDTTSHASLNLESTAPVSTSMTNSLPNSPPHPPTHSMITRAVNEPSRARY